ncbi:phage EaA protein [Klebsiella pneumoniae]|uniref:hypothetical protein n=1 Tax=Klebsiella pneumoniae TaxID=573 RepID=UPI0009BBE06A|nr:hypothetical protein [Klebsiella pneumoniae]SLO47995.1 phage EaA protein [Klebsiella pneumoniae]
MTDITELAQLRGRTVDYPYYLVECDCGKIYPSSELSGGEPIGDSGDYSDCYCPHCGEGEEHFAECADPETAWKAQQDKIDALVEALEKAQQRIAELELHKAALLKFIRESCYVFDGYDADISDAYIDAASSNLMPKIEAEPCHHCSDGSYSGLPGGACEHCMGTGLDNPAAELESRTVKLPKLKMLEDYLAEVAIEERKQILVGVKLEFHRACVAAGIKVEAE